MNRPDWAPPSIDIERPSAARIYDYLLGGSHNFEPDRQAARAVISIAPDAPLAAQANRAFLRRAVRYLANSGVRQFLDIGSGIPTLGNVHEVARSTAPDTRVVYLDTDPVAVAHSREILAGHDRATVVQGDVRHPGRILDHPEVTRLIDFNRPVALIMMAVMHFIPDDDDPRQIVTTLRDGCAPGSYLAMSHATDESRPEQETQAGTAVYQRAANPLSLRTRAEVRRFFDGYELLDPGVVWVPEWRPDSPDEVGDQPERTGLLGGVGRLA